VHAASVEAFDTEELALLHELAGDLAFALQSIEDETARKQAEESLYANATRFRALIENSTDVVALAGADGSLSYVSPSISRALGYTGQELVGQSLFDFVYPDDRPRLTARFAELTQRPADTRAGEYRALHKDGSWRWIEGVGSNLLAEPSVQAIVVNFRDITERKQHAREIEALALVATALRAAPSRGDMLLVILNEVLALLHARGAAVALRNPASPGAVVALARGDWEDWTGVYLAPVEEISAHVIATGRPYLSHDVPHDSFVARPRLPGNLHAVACMPLISQGEAIGALWVGRRSDITPDEMRLLSAIGDIVANALHRALIVESLERRVAERTRELAKANERLTELDRLKSKFVSDVSHELRTPVANLSLYVDLLQHGKPEKHEKYLNGLREQAGLLKRLVDDILDLSRLERDQAAGVLAPADLNAAAEQVVAAHQPRADLAGLTLTFAPDPDLPPVRGNYDQLIQIITNLVANALNYTRAGQVRISTQHRDDRAYLQVQDTGLGIDDMDIPHLFERFYRGTGAARSGTPGTGLGLSIVKEIVDLHGGEIEVTSRVGEGTTFKVWLPIAGEMV